MASKCISLAVFGFVLVSVLAQDDFQCPERTGFYPDSFQCDLYYHCQQGKPESKLCPDGLVFSDRNPKQEHCDIPSNVDCGERNELQEPKPTPGCPRANGFFRHSDAGICDKFFNCVDGAAMEMPCPPGLIFDDSTSASTCAWPAETKRECTNTKRESLADGFTCPDGDTQGPNGRVLPHPTFPHPEDCKKFYICRNAVVPQPGSCEEGEVYSEDLFKCEDPATVPGCENYYEGKETGKKSSKN